MTVLCFNTFNRSAYHGVDADLCAQAEAAAAAGFTAIGPDIFSIDAHREQHGSLDDLRARLVALDLAVPEIAALGVTGDRAATEQEARRLARAVSELGITWVLTNIYEEPSEAVAASFAAAADILRHAGARLALEFMPISAVTSVPEARALIAASGASDAGVLVDSWHIFRGPTTWDELAALPRDQIAYVQFDDALPVVGADLVAETLERRVMPGEGEFDLDRFCATLRATGFDGVVSVEVLNGELRNLDVREFARRAYESSARYWPDAS